MSFYVENLSSATNFKNVPGGLHLARCYRIVDLGTQKSEYNGETSFKRKVMIGWELHGEDSNGAPLTIDDGKPMAIFKNYTLSWGEKASLRIDLQAWRGKPFSAEEMNRFDLKNILGQWCMVNVIEKPVNGKLYSNVASLAPVPQVVKTTGLPKGVNVCQMFNIDEPDMDVFETFSKNLKAKIEASPEWRAKHGFNDVESEDPYAPPF
jgi:hypothetical protein